jgi:hypothetical protein
MLKSLLFVSVFLMFCNFTVAYSITKCDFVDEMLEVGTFSFQKIEDHICAAFGDKSFRVLPNFEGHVASIYRIRKEYWCDENKKGGSCDIQCSKLEDKDIRDDIRCADKIMTQQGRSAFDLSLKCNINDVKNDVKLCLFRNTFVKNNLAKYMIFF